MGARMTGVTRRDPLRLRRIADKLAERGRMLGVRHVPC